MVMKLVLSELVGRNSRTLFPILLFLLWEKENGKGKGVFGKFKSWGAESLRAVPVSLTAAKLRLDKDADDNRFG